MSAEGQAGKGESKVRVDQVSVRGITLLLEIIALVFDAGCPGGEGRRHASAPMLDVEGR